MIFDYILTQFRHSGQRFLLSHFYIGWFLYLLPKFGLHSRQRMSKDQGDVIEIDDSDPSQDAPEPPKLAKPPANINSFNFPRLHSMLQKHTAKTKTEETKKTAEAFTPEVIKNTVDDNEVCSVVPIMHYAAQFERQQMAENNMLSVDECFEPIVSIYNSKQDPSAQTPQPPLSQERDKPAEKAEESSLQAEQPPSPPEHPILSNPPTPEPEAKPSELQQGIQHIDAPIQQPVEQHEENKPEDEDIQAVAEIENSQAVEDSHAGVEKQQCSLSQLEQVLTTQQIKKLLQRLLPELGNAIEDMNNQEILGIYATVKSEMPEHEMRVLIQEQQALLPSQPIQKSRDPPSEEGEAEERPPIVEEAVVEARPVLQINSNWSEVQTLQYFKTLPFLDLRAVMNKYFKYENDQFDSMDHAALLEILDQTIKEFEITEGGHPQHQPEQHQHSPDPIQTHSSAEPVPLANEEEAEAQQMREFLLSNIPSIEAEQLEGISSHYLRMLYDDARNGRLSRVEIKQRADCDPLSLLHKAQKASPHLDSQLSRVTEQELQELMSSLTGKTAPTAKANSAHEQAKSTSLAFENSNISITVPQRPPEPEDIPTVNHKRTHDEMQSTNPRRSEDRRRTPHELREKLIARLPDLKENIMKLDDSEISKIYRDSLENNRTRAKPRDPEGRPVIIIKEKRLADSTNRRPDPADPDSNRPDPESNNDRLIRIPAQEKGKRSRTIIFVHTEQLSDDEAAPGFKVKRTPPALEKKTCECFQKETVGELLKRLAEMVDKKA